MGKSLIYIKESSGERLAPHRTPDVTLERGDWKVLSDVNLNRELRMFLTQETIWGWSLREDSLDSRRILETRSQTFKKLRKMASV